MKSTLLPRAVTAAACAFFGAPALAQQTPVPQAPQVTPRDLRPETRPAAPATLPHTAPEAVPAQSEGLFVTVAAIVVDGGFDELAPASQSLPSSLLGQRHAVADFYRLAAAIESLYHDAGYPLARVALPPQSLADGGTLHLRVVDGFIERVDTAGVPVIARERVQRVLESLAGRPRLRSAALERALTLAGRIPGLSLRSALGAGQAPGATVLVVEGEVTAHVASLEVDNHLARSLGPVEATLQLRVNQPLDHGLGEQLYGYMSADPNPSHSFATLAPRVVSGFGVQWPVGLDGLQLNPEYTSSSTNPPSGPTTLRTESLFERYTLRAIYPLLLDHARELTLTGTLEATTQSTLAPDFAFTLNQDRLRVGRLTLEWTGSVATAHVRASATGSQGIAGLGYRSAADANASLTGFSRPAMRPDFSKLEIDLSADVALPQGLQSTTSWRSQLAKGVLPSSELFSLDGDDALSAYTSGALSNDTGYTLREELGRPVGLGTGNGAVSVLPYAYAAYGRGMSKLAGDASQGRDAAYGAGLRASWHAFSLGAEYGRRRAHLAGLDGNQLFVKAQVQF
jgi:hemolysin activation/secretion protein